MEGQWRSEIPEDMRKTMITEMYHELARISGEVDKQKVWGSAAKFELMLWSSSPDRNSYLMKMQRKIVSLKKKQGADGANLMANANNVVTSNAMNPAVNGMASGLNMNMNAAMNAQFQQNNAVASQAMNNFQQQAQAQAQVQAHAQAQAQVQAQAQAQQQNAAALATSNGASVGASTDFNAAVTGGLNSSNAGPTAAVNNPTPPQQQAQQWLQRIQVQFQAQQRQLMHTQNQETQQLRQQHMNQQQQLSQQQQQQGIAPDMRRQQLQTLQQQHQLARTRLQHLHKSKQQQLQRKQQQYLMQKQHQLQQQQQHQQQGSIAATTATASTNGVSSTAMMAASQAGVVPSSLSLPNATTVQTSAPTVSTTQVAATLPAAQRGVKPEQLAAAHTQQAAMRELQRAQNAAQIHVDNGLTHKLFNGTAASTASSTPTGAATGTATATSAATTTGSSIQTYVERLKETKQKYWDDLVIVYREFERMVKQKPANQQQERINTFLVNLKRIIALLQQDPSKVTNNNKNDLDRVEAHIQKQVLPILERLKNKTRAAAATAGNNGLAAAQQEQMKKTQEAQRLAQLQEQQKKMQEQEKAEAQRKLLEEQKKKLQLEAAAAAAAAVKKQEMLEQQRKQKQKQLQAQHAQQQAILQQQQQQRQRLLVQQAQLKAQNQLRMNGAAPQQAKTAAGTVGVTPSAIVTAGDDLTTTNTTNGTGVSPTSASLPTPIDIPVSLSPGETNTLSGMASLTSAQYRTFKLPEARKQQLTAQHGKLREQQQELIMQQSRAKTPSHQAKLAHQAQRLAQMTNKISQQLVQCKLAEEYEQSKSMGMATIVSQPTLSQSIATPVSLDKVTTVKLEITASGNRLATSASEVTAPATTLAATTDETAVVSAVAASVPGITAKTNDNFKSVLPDMTGLSASEKLLTAVAAYEKHKPDVLKRGALRFSRIAVTIGAKLNTSYVT